MYKVLDSGIFMNLSELPNIDGEVFLTPNTLDEIKSNLSTNVLTLFLATRKPNIVEPDEKHLSQVVLTAKKMGQNKLSNVDIEVIGLALMLMEQNKVTIVSDDFGIRNVAHELRIPSIGIKTSGGNKKRLYKYICEGCSQVYYQIENDCEICGSMNFKRKRRS